MGEGELISQRPKTYTKQWSEKEQVDVRGSSKFPNEDPSMVKNPSRDVTDCFTKEPVTISGKDRATTSKDSCMQMVVTFFWLLTQIKV